VTSLEVYGMSQDITFLGHEHDWGHEVGLIGSTGTSQEMKGKYREPQGIKRHGGGTNGGHAMGVIVHRGILMGHQRGHNLH
jgi:hypothetical protein